MQTDPTTLRLFIAVWLPEYLRGNLERASADFRRTETRARFARSDGLHITLAFLGDRPVAEAALLTESLAPVCRTVTPFSLLVGSPGCFPPHGEPRVLWYGVDDDAQALAALQRELVQALRFLAIPGDYQRFTPHITMARLNGSRTPVRPSTVRERWSTRPVPTATPFTVRSVWLMHSASAPGGALYTGLKEWPLADMP